MKRLLNIISTIGIALCVAWLIWLSIINCPDIVYIIAGIVVLWIMHVYSNLE